MNYSKQILSFICIGLLLTLAGCAKKSNYKPRQLKSLKELVHIDYQETKEQVTVRAKVFNKLDCDYVFGERADRIIGEKEPLQPIQLCIENQSCNSLKLAESGIDLPLISSKEISYRLGTRSRYLAGSICGGIGLCGILAGVGALVAAWPITCPCILIPVIFYAGLGSLFVIASPFAFLIENCGTRDENNKIKNHVYSMNVGKELVINPGKVIDVVVFVKKHEYKQTFKCTLINDKTSKEIPFMIKLDDQK